ncbi:serpin family protein [Hymenobacter ruricola]|uniref:Serpin family protein n=1 Tax=Hymenobacter ruricola TaxID=2791023 RepID=A0ABS0I5W3_9BACT|nr:serpin family protein [Hymenobacter ruricola]MBF9222331.1 serpin family protein [Hymenobacter ruricola]
MSLFSYFRPKDIPSALPTAQHRFDLNLVREVAQHGSGNFTVSPLGVLAALSLAMNGAGGTTHQEFGNVLFGSLGDASGAVAAVAAWLRQLLTKDARESAELTLATSLWANQHFTLAPAFIEQAHALYEAEAGTLDFTTAEAASTINNWVREHTQGRIPTMVEAQALMNAPPAVLLLNAVYFRAKWDSPFYEGNTRPGPFRLADGRQQEAQLMHQVSAHFGYLAGQGWQAVSLPYFGYPSRFAMLVFVPHAPSGLPAFLTALNATTWAQWLPSFSERDELEVDLTLPRFRVEWEADLVPVLDAMGLRAAFARGADFAPMGFRAEDGGGFVSAVLHKTFLEVDEEGTEAAAATAVLMMAGGAPPTPKRRVEVKVDSPFFYAIVDQQDGAVVFAGTVNELVSDGARP